MDLTRAMVLFVPAGVAAGLAYWWIAYRDRSTTNTK
jgi:hypothetical protein